MCHIINFLKKIFFKKIKKLYIFLIKGKKKKKIWGWLLGHLGCGWPPSLVMATPIWPVWGWPSFHPMLLNLITKDLGEKKSFHRPSPELHHHHRKVQNQQMAMLH
jgi:hypothetical protein